MSPIQQHREGSESDPATKVGLCEGGPADRKSLCQGMGLGWDIPLCGDLDRPLQWRVP